jgi:BirA family biotin operon repressor/biotin-[acetyl-CoA-carboxylase] ligase
VGRFDCVDFPLTRAAVPRLLWRDETASTNDDVREGVALADAANWPNFTAAATLAQGSGRGRLGRSWDAPQGTSLAVSLLVRPSVRSPGWRTEGLGWLSLAAGLAMTETVRGEFARAGVDPARAELKWPNDVLVRDPREHSQGARKISGILCEIVAAPGGVPAIIIGAGLNIGFGRATAPVPIATSLAIEGVMPEGSPSVETVDSLLADYLTRLTALVSRFFDADGDARASGILDEVGAACATIGRRVRVERVGEDELVGAAIGLDDAGQLIVRPDTASGKVAGEVPGTLAVAAGDVTHLRY